MGRHLAANSSKAVSISPAGLCGHGYKYGQAKAPEKETCAESPRFAEARAASNTCSTAQDCLAFGLPLSFSGANPSNATSYAGCTATNCPCKCVESSVISN